jgi:GNAT superfamily N-acetyltransferase
MHTVIRKAELTDSEKFAKLNCSFWNASYNDCWKFYRETMKLFLSGYFLAEVNSDIVGSSEGFPIEAIKPIALLSAERGVHDLFDLSGKYYYVHLILVLPEFRNRGIGDLLFKAQLNVALKYGAEYLCAVSLEEKILHWIKYGFMEYGESQYRENFGILKWLKMNIG